MGGGASRGRRSTAASDSAHSAGGAARGQRSVQAAADAKRVLFYGLDGAGKTWLIGALRDGCGDGDGGEVGGGADNGAALALPPGRTAEVVDTVICEAAQALGGDAGGMPGKAAPWIAVDLPGRLRFRAAGMSRLDELAAADDFAAGGSIHAVVVVVDGRSARRLPLAFEELLWVLHHPVVVERHIPVAVVVTEKDITEREMERERAEEGGDNGGEEVGLNRGAEGLGRGPVRPRSATAALRSWVERRGPFETEVRIAAGASAKDAMAAIRWALPA